MNTGIFEQRVYVVDDDDSVRDSLDAFLSASGLKARTYSDPLHFLADHHQGIAGCLILDIHLPALSGLDVQQQLVAVGSTLPIIFITGRGDVATAVQAMKAGAFEFLEKPFRHQTLLDHVRRALEVDSSRRQTMLREQQVRDRIRLLTPRETEVLREIVDGKATKVIAIDKGLSQRTVEIYRANIMQKMQSRSVAQLVKTIGESGIKPESI